MDDVTKPQAHDAATATVTLDLPAEVGELSKVIDPLREWLVAYGCSLAFVNRMAVAVEELFVNVASYAYGKDRGRVQLTYAFSKLNANGSVEVIVTIEDNGIPFNPVARPNPTPSTSIEEAKIGGLGIFLAKKNVDKMAYERKDGTNIVTLTKCWKATNS